MAKDFFIATRRRYVMRLRVLGTLSTGDDQDFGGIPFKSGKLLGAVIAVLVGGTASGSTTITLERHRNEDGGNDMLTAAQGIAHDAGTLHKEIDRTVIVATGPEEVQQGDQIGLNVEAIPGGSNSTDLTVDLIFQIDRE